MQKHSPEEQREAYDALPRPAREFLAGASFGDLMETFGQKYGLHVDVVGQLSQAVSYMLLGFINPSQFQDELKTMGIPDTTTGTIIQDLNEKVFKPLQEKIRNAPPEEPEQEEEEPTSPSPAPAPLVPVAKIEVRQAQPTTPIAPPTAVLAPEPAPELIQEQQRSEPEPLFVSPARPVIPPIAPKPPASPDQNREALRQVLEGYKGTDPYRETPE